MIIISIDNKAKNSNSIFLVVIIAIVAIVGIVALTLNTQTKQITLNEDTFSEDENLAGDAKYSALKTISNSKLTKSTVSSKGTLTTTKTAPAQNRCTRNSDCESSCIGDPEEGQRNIGYCSLGTCKTRRSDCVEGYECNKGECNRIITDCNDERDNDNDGRIDFPEDDGCTSAIDNSESDCDSAQFDVGVGGLYEKGIFQTDVGGNYCKPSTRKGTFYAFECLRGRDANIGAFEKFYYGSTATSRYATASRSPYTWQPAYDDQRHPLFGDSNHCMIACENGIDDDGDGLTDEEDPNCNDPPADITGLTDYDVLYRQKNALDESTWPINTYPYNYHVTGPSCINNRDDDQDGVLDSEDPDCAGFNECYERYLAHMDSCNSMSCGVSEANYCADYQENTYTPQFSLMSDSLGYR